MKKDVLNSKLSMVRLKAKLDTLKKDTGMVVQSLLFSRENFSEKTAKSWADKHGYKSKTLKKTDNYIRFRQKIPGRFKDFKTVSFAEGVKAVVAGTLRSRFAGSIALQNFSKFSEVKSDLDINIPMMMDIKILCDGKNRDGIITRDDLEESLDGWKDIPLVDVPHDLSAEGKNKPTSTKISDRVGYTTDSPVLKYIDGKMWVVVPAEVNNRTLAYQLYLRAKKGKPLEVSAEFAWTPYFIGGEKHQTNIRPHMITIVDKGHVKGNALAIVSE